MAHRYALTGINPEDPTHLYIDTDDDTIIVELEQPRWRSADVIIRTFVRDWNEYAPQDEAGVPLPKDITQFMAYVEAVFGAQTYMVRLLW